MKAVFRIALKELRGYFLTPIAPVFLMVFGILSVCTLFFWGDFFLLREASLRAYFYRLPFLWVLFVPAAGMRLWSEERRQQTLELLLTMPVSLAQAVLGKYLAGVVFLFFGLLMSAPLAGTVCWIGEPDTGMMLCGYFGGWLLSAAMLAVCSLVSALTSNQVISYIAGAAVCLLTVSGGHPSTVQFLRQWVGDGVPGTLVSCLSVTQRAESFREGLIDAGDCLYLLSVCAVFLWATVRALDSRRASR